MGVVDNIKEITGLIQKIDNIELYRKILDLHAEVLGLVDENRGLRDKVQALEGRLAVRENLVFQGSVYIIRNDDGSSKGPFCTGCWDGKNLLARLVDYGSNTYLNCPNCSKTFKTLIRPHG